VLFISSEALRLPPTPDLVGNVMSGWPRSIVSIAAAVAIAMPLTAAQAQRGLSFAIVGAPVDRAAVLIARPNKAMLKLRVRPAAAVSLDQPISADVAQQIGVKRQAPFVSGRHLYGWPEAPGLYCDLLRSSGLGASSICLQDTDRDGRFDQAIRLGYNSAQADLLLVTSGGKIDGAKVKGDPVRLPRPVPYSKVSPSPDVTGKLAVTWAPGLARLGSAGKIIFSIGDQHYYQDTGVAPLTVATIPTPQAPVDVAFAGVKLRVLGFDEKGAMRYSVLQVSDGAAIPMAYLGSRLVIIGY
jgi:hypothetical protein